MVRSQRFFRGGSIQHTSAVFLNNEKKVQTGTSNTNLGAAKYESGGVYFAFLTVNTAKYSPKYFRICEYGPYLAFLPQTVLVIGGYAVQGRSRLRLVGRLPCSACFAACCYCMTAGWGESEVFMGVSFRRLAPVLHRHLPASCAWPAFFVQFA